MGLLNNQNPITTIANGWVIVWTVDPVTGNVSPGEKIKVEDFFSDAYLSSAGVLKWQGLLKQAIASDKLRSLDGANVQSQTSENGTYYTTNSTINLPAATNNEGILEVRNQDDRKYFRYFTFNVGRIEIWTQHFDGTDWSVWNYANGESSLAFIGGLTETAGVIRQGGILDQNVSIDLDGKSYQISGDDAEFIIELLNTSSGNSSALTISTIIALASGEISITIDPGGIELSDVPKYIKRKTLPGNDTQNAVGNTVYITDASTANMPATTLVGVLEAFDHNASGDIELRYTTFTAGKMEIWGRKKEGASWYNWIQIAGGGYTTTEYVDNNTLSRPTTEPVIIAGTPDTLLLDCENKKEIIFEPRLSVGTLTIPSDFTLALTNTANALLIGAVFSITGTVAITFPSDFLCSIPSSIGNWTSQVLTLSAGTDDLIEVQMLRYSTNSKWIMKVSEVAV